MVFLIPDTVNTVTDNTYYRYVARGYFKSELNYKIIPYNVDEFGDASIILLYDNISTADTIPASNATVVFDKIIANICLQLKGFIY